MRKGRFLFPVCPDFLWELEGFIVSFQKVKLQAEVDHLSENKKMAEQLSKDFSDKQAVRDKESRDFDHEFANEPLTEKEKLNNKKTKKRQ